jgi:WhiB family transcriptional regulator, redox-sensing transcriptional regulator
MNTQAMLQRGESWEALGACRDTSNPDRLFFPRPGKSPIEGRRVCDQCPVRSRCLDTAMTLEEGLDAKARYGIWGGLIPAERALLEVQTTGKKPVVRGPGLARCQTKTAVRRHERRGESCDVCDAWREARRQPQPECGTNGGYFRHRRLRDETCERCRAAHRAVAYGLDPASLRAAG